MGKYITIANKCCLACGEEFGRESCKQLSDYKVKKFCSHKCSMAFRVENYYLDIGDKIRDNVNITVGSGCWNWRGPIMKGRGGAYGYFKLRGKRILAHRASYLHFRGKIKDGLLVCHTCDNPGCVNPEHLFLGTQLSNMRDMASKLRGTNGTKAFRSKLNDDAVRQIRSLHDRGALQKDLAFKYKVSRPTISEIVSGKAWRHV